MTSVLNFPVCSPQLNQNDSTTVIRIGKYTTCPVYTTFGGVCRVRVFSTQKSSILGFGGVVSGVVGGFQLHVDESGPLGVLFAKIPLFTLPIIFKRRDRA